MTIKSGKRCRFSLCSAMLGLMALGLAQPMQAATANRQASVCPSPRHSVLTKPPTRQLPVKPSTRRLPVKPSTRQLPVKSSTRQIQNKPSIYRAPIKPTYRPVPKPLTHPHPSNCGVTTSSTAEQYQTAMDYSQANSEDGLLILQGGSILVERYSGSYSTTSPHPLNSGSKSFSGLIAIAAAQDGLLNLDEPVANTITEWQSDPNKAPITVRQLLTLTSGLSVSPTGQVPTFSNAIQIPSQYPAGSTFRYGSDPFQVFGELMRRKLGSDPLAYLQSRVLTPIGLQIKYWARLSDGNPNMASGAGFTAQEWSKIGLLLKQNGQWQSQTVLAPMLMPALLSGTSANAAYGLTFWLNNPGFGVTNKPRPNVSTLPSNAFWAAGTRGQRLYVIPSQDLVIVRFGNSESFNDLSFLGALPSSP